MEPTIRGLSSRLGGEASQCGGGHGGKWAAGEDICRLLSMLALNEKDLVDLGAWHLRPVIRRPTDMSYLIVGQVNRLLKQGNMKKTKQITHRSALHADVAMDEVEACLGTGAWW